MQHRKRVPMRKWVPMRMHACHRQARALPHAMHVTMPTARLHNGSHRWTGTAHGTPCAGASGS